MNNKRLDTFFEFSNAYLFVIEDEIIIDVNSTFCNSYNYKKEDLIGKKIGEIILINDFQSFKEEFQSNDKITSELARGRKRVSIIEWSLQSNNNLVYLEGNDISEKLKYQDEIKQYIELLQEATASSKGKDKELDEFTHSISHDLKAPLRAIKSLIGFVKEDIDPEVLSDETKNDFTLIEQRADRMDSMIEGLSQYSRIGKDKTESNEFEIKSLIEDVVNHSNSNVSKVQFEIKGSFSKVNTKEFFVMQIISNLISNAIKFNKNERPLVKICGVEKEGEGLVEISIEDNGPGIPEEYREKIFGVFQTLQSRDKLESTGIGLTIVKKMVAQIGGEVWVEDSDLGGAKFVFNFVQNLRD